MPHLRYCSFIPIFLILSLFPGPAGSADNDAALNQQQLKVFVSILPSEYFVHRIGGKRVQAEALVRPGHSPATYSPTPKQMADLASSRLYFRIGVPFEKALLPRISRAFPDLRVVDLQQNIDLQNLEEPGTHDDHAHPEGDIDPHTWLDPLLALKQAAIIMKALAEIDPPGKEEYEANYRKLAVELQELDTTLRVTLAPYAGRTVYVFHPAYGYFCRAYNLRQKAITPGGKEPGAKYIARLIEDALQEKVRVIFVQPQFSDKAAGTIARAIDGTVVALDPLAYDYMENLQHMARQIRDALVQD